MSVRKIMTLAALVCAALALTLLTQTFLGYTFFGASLLVGGAMAAQWIATYTIEAFDNENK